MQMLNVYDSNFYCMIIVVFTNIIIIVIIITLIIINISNDLFFQICIPFSQQWLLDSQDLIQERQADLEVLSEEEYMKIMNFFANCKRGTL